MRLLLLLAVSALPAAAQVAPSELPLTPPLLRDRWIADMRTKSLEDVLNLYVPDAVFVSPKGTIVSSSSDLRKLYTGVFGTYDADITLAKPRHHDTGEPRHPTSTVDEGTYRESLRNRSTGMTQTLCGRYTFTYVKATGGGTGWRFSRMEWTSEPCPAQP